MSQAGHNTQLFLQDLVTELRAHLLPGTEEESVKGAFAILDGASIPDLLNQLHGRGRPEFVCLYRGELEPDMAEVAPYLVRLEPGTPFTEWLLAHGWGSHWGIFVRTRADLGALRRHLRGFLMVQDVAGEQLYFRYYDPRVLRRFLPIGDAAQLQRIFGLVECYLCEGTDRTELLKYRCDGREFTAEHFELIKVPGSREAGQTAKTVRALAPVPALGRSEVLMAIRKEQIEALAAPRRAELAPEIARYLREQCPAQVQAMNDVQLEAFAREQMAQAARHGITIEWDVCRFCWLAAWHRPRFGDECDWARKVLESSGSTSTERMNLLEYHQRNYLEPMFHPA